MCVGVCVCTRLISRWSWSVWTGFLSNQEASRNAGKQLDKQGEGNVLFQDCQLTVAVIYPLRVYTDPEQRHTDFSPSSFSRSFLLSLCSPSLATSDVNNGPASSRGRETRRPEVSGVHPCTAEKGKRPEIGRSAREAGSPVCWVGLDMAENGNSKSTNRIVYFVIRESESTYF